MHDTPMKPLFEQRRALSAPAAYASRAYSIGRMARAGTNRARAAGPRAADRRGRASGRREPNPSGAGVLRLHHGLGRADGDVEFRPDIYGRDGNVDQMAEMDRDPNEPAPTITWHPDSRAGHVDACALRCSRVGRLAARVGLEPTTVRLTVGCSTTELPRNSLVCRAWRLLAESAGAGQRFARPAAAVAGDCIPTLAALNQGLPAPVCGTEREARRRALAARVSPGGELPEGPKVALGIAARKVASVALLADIAEHLGARSLGPRGGGTASAKTIYGLWVVPPSAAGVACSLPKSSSRAEPSMIMPSPNVSSACAMPPLPSSMTMRRSNPNAAHSQWMI